MNSVIEYQESTRVPFASHQATSDSHEHRDDAPEDVVPQPMEPSEGIQRPDDSVFVGIEEEHVLLERALRLVLRGPAALRRPVGRFCRHRQIRAGDVFARSQACQFWIGKPEKGERTRLTEVRVELRGVGLESHGAVLWDADVELGAGDLAWWQRHWAGEV